MLFDKLEGASNRLSTQMATGEVSAGRTIEESLPAVVAGDRRVPHLHALL